MPLLEPPASENFRRDLREKALNHSLFYLKLGARVANTTIRDPSPVARRGSESVSAHAPNSGRVVHLAQPRVSDLLRRLEPTPMQYQRPPRAASPQDDIFSSDDDRAAVRCRSRDLSDDSAVELDTRRRHPIHHPRDAFPPPDTMSPR